MNREITVAVIGGGAAGLAAAIFCARRIGGERVMLFEKQPRVGKKLLATGNGTCNLSNTAAQTAYYHGASPAFADHALSRFSPSKAMVFFESIGLHTVVREDGRIYPLCAQASAVLDCLRLELDRLGVVTCCETPVTALKPCRNGVVIVTDKTERTAKRVLVATGGAASEKLGGTTDGYRLLGMLGHEKTPIFPSIVQIRTDREAVKAVKGIRVDAAVSLCLNGRCVAKSAGEILFADYGVSGPAAMAIGRAAADWERRKKGAMTLVLDVLPTLDEETLEHDIDRRCRLSGRTLEELLTGLLQKRLAQTVIKAAGLAPLSRKASSLTPSEKQRLVRTLKAWTLTVTGSAGMNAAQVTAGGMDTAQFDPATMRSCLVPNVYAAGEVLDIDGDCGGFNLQWAWSSAYTAAMAMTEEYV